MTTANCCVARAEAALRRLMAPPVDAVDAPRASRRSDGGDRVRSPWLTFALCALTAYISALDLSIVNVAFPEILRDLKSTRANLSWIVTAYNICFAGLLIVSGKVADQLGRRRLFLVGVGIFGTGSLLCAVSPGLGPLVAGRAVQGIGGALLTPAALGLLLAAFPAERRPGIIAMWGAIGALGIASGPSLGAVLITVTNWRAAFWVNVPICVAVIVFGRIQLRETTLVPDGRIPDFLGALMITVALAALALGISRSEVWGWTDSRTVASLAVATVSVPLFWWRQGRHPNPILDVSLFNSRPFTVANLSTVAFYAGFGSSGLNNVLFLRQVWGYTVLHAGLLSAIAPLTVALMSRKFGRLGSRFGFRPLVVAGPAIVAFGALLLRALLGSTPRPWLFVAIAECLAVGIAAFIPVNTAAALSDLPPERLSIGGAVNNTCRQIGSVVGIAVLVAVLGSPTTPTALLNAHRRGWIVVAVVTALAALVGLAQPGLSGTTPTDE